MKSFWLLQADDSYGKIWVSEYDDQYLPTTQLEEALRFSNKKDAEYYLKRLLAEYINDHVFYYVISKMKPTEHKVM